MGLDLSKFQVVFDDQFSKDTALNKSLWSDSWGNHDQYTFSGGALTLTGYQDPWWQPVGFMQKAIGPTAGEGYGLYQFTAYGNPGQGIGISLLLWRADNQFLDAKNPYKASEIDILESWDRTKTAQATVHWYDPSAPGNDYHSYHQVNVDPTQSHTYALDWERGSLTYYVDGNQVYQDTAHAPLDAADGGSNEVIGAQVINEANLVTTPTVQLHITDISYSAPISANLAVTLGAGPQNYVAVAGAVVQAGSGSDTINAAGGQVHVTGNSGTLTFLGGSGPSTVSGGTGSATIYGGSGGNYAGGGAGHNVLVSQIASGGNATLTGGGAGDQIFGSAGGNDVIVAGPGSETILGGGGSSTITGGTTAASVIFTGGGPSSVLGGMAGGDTIVGGAGTLNVTAAKGAAVFGGTGTLNATGSTSGADSVVGGAGALTFNGQGANLLIVAGSTTSNVHTGNGASLIFGGVGSTTVSGGAGSMEITLGSGGVTASEGTGTSVYDVVKGAAGGTDVLTGFHPGRDKINLFGYQPSEHQVIKASGSTQINLSDGTKIQLVGVSDPGSSIVG